jgi:hypothetical protein
MTIVVVGLVCLAFGWMLGSSRRQRTPPGNVHPMTEADVKHMWNAGRQFEREENSRRGQKTLIYSGCSGSPIPTIYLK